jgi:hypothetical protein
MLGLFLASSLHSKVSRRPQTKHLLALMKVEQNIALKDAEEANRSLRVVRLEDCELVAFEAPNVKLVLIAQRQDYPVLPHFVYLVDLLPMH